MSASTRCKYLVSGPWEGEEYRQKERRIKPIRTVVVDDCPEFLDLVCTLLEREEMIEVVGCAGDGVEAINAVAQSIPDLVIMDVNMPYLDGLTCAALILSHYSTTRVILMSAEDSSQMRHTSELCGAVSFIHKANFSQALTAALRPLLDRWRG